MYSYLSFTPSIGRIMAQAVAFQAALQRIGFSQPATAAITANGIHTAQDLIGLDDKDIEQILKIIRLGPPPICFKLTMVVVRIRKDLKE